MSFVRVPLTFQLLSLGLVVQGRVFGQEADPASKIYAKTAKSVLLILLRSTDSRIVAQGTGFLVEGGKIITNEHVIRGGTPLIDVGGARIPATVDSADTVNDLAVLSTVAEVSGEPLVLAEKLPSPGSNVFAIGNPRGLENSISTGVVAGIRKIGNRELLQITTPISPGSSGGPVLDSTGKVVGVTVGSIEEGQNLNFAVPASAVLKLLHAQSRSGDAASLLERAESLIAKRTELQYSDDSASPYQTNEAQIKATVSTAIDSAGKDDVNSLMRIVEEFSESYYIGGNADLAVLAAERSVAIKSSSDGNLALAKALDLNQPLQPAATRCRLVAHPSRKPPQQGR